MKQTKLKFIFVQLFSMFLFMQFSYCVSKCNLPMLRKFTLTGMKYSLYDKMKICAHVHDKCCTVADEIKIIKLWQQRASVILEQNIDMSIFYMKRITDQFEELARLDPRLLAVKYVVQRQVPYIEQYCTFYEKSSGVHNHVSAIRIYEQSLRNSMRRLVDKIFPGKNEARNLKYLYQDQSMVDNSQQSQLEDEELNVLAENKEVDKGQRILYRGQDLLSHSRIQQMQGMEVEYMESACNVRKNSFYKDFIILNANKSDRCMNLLDKAFDFNNKQFKGYLGKVKAGLMKVMRYKANFYCALCDAHNQKFFNVAKKQFIFSQGFCRNILIKNEAHIKFINVILIQYIDFLIQLMTCYGTNGDAKSFGIVNFLQKYKRRIPLIQKCYQSLQNGDDFFGGCWFLCHSYKVMEVSPFYEGDVNLYKKVYLALYSFLRKFEKGQVKLDEDNNIDGLLTEPLNPGLTVSSKFALDSKTRKQVLGKVINAKKLNKVQIAKLKEFFKKHRLKGFKTFVRNYQKLFPKGKLYKKPVTKNEKKLFKHIKGMYKNKVMEIKNNLRKNPHMDVKVLELFKKLFKQTFMNYDAVEHITPEVRPLRQLNGFQQRILSTKLEDTNRQARIIKEKIRNLKLLRDKKHLEQKGKVRVSKNIKIENKKPKEDRKVPVEPGSQIYTAVVSMFDLSDFYLEYKEDGMDISKFVNLVDFDLDATQLVSEKLSKNPKINLSVVNSYLSIRPKQINQFNHIWKDLIIPAIEMKQLNEKYTKKRAEKLQAHAEGDYKKTMKIEGEIRLIHAKAKQELKKKQDKQDLIDYKNKFKQMKLEKKQKEKIVLNHHVDQPKFEKNFYGIKDLFLKLFGP